MTLNSIYLIFLGLKASILRSKSAKSVKNLSENINQVD